MSGIYKMEFQVFSSNGHNSQSVGGIYAISFGLHLFKRFLRIKKKSVCFTTLFFDYYKCYQLSLSLCNASMYMLMGVPEAINMVIRFKKNPDTYILTLDCWCCCSIYHKHLIGIAHYSKMALSDLLHFESMTILKSLILPTIWEMSFPLNKGSIIIIEAALSCLFITQKKKKTVKQIRHLKLTLVGDCSLECLRDYQADQITVCCCSLAAFLLNGTEKWVDHKETLNNVCCVGINQCDNK